MMALEHFDVLIIGAGPFRHRCRIITLQKFCPSKSYVILEQRERIGGTWDLFRYPGIRSDSDMLTMGYSFRPWTSPKAISPGEDIRAYIIATAQEAGIDRHIRFRHEVKSAAWSSQEAQWEVTAIRKLPDGGEESLTFTCNFLFSCAGYYRYSAGYLPEFPGVSRFHGLVIHPQAWPENLDYSGKRVVIIGSGATAVTLLPSIAKTAAHVTMLQRSPTYVVSLPEQDRIANWLRGKLPPIWAYRLSRLKNVAFMIYFYQLAQHFPNFVKNGIIKNVSESVGPNCDVATNFTPRYNPWQQRLCLVPDGDMFKAIRSGRASVVTGHIQTFTEQGIAARIGRDTRSRYRCHGYRPCDAGLWRRPSLSRWTQCRSQQHHGVQRRHALRRAEPRLGVWLYQCILDPQSRFDLQLCLPLVELYGQETRPPGHTSASR
jgi:monooxygenase